MNTETINKIANRLKNKNEIKDYLETQLRGLLQTSDIVTFIPHGNPFGNTVKIPVTTEAVVAAYTRELDVLKQEMLQLSKEMGEALGV